jgi:hypothetical protein
MMVKAFQGRVHAPAATLAGDADCRRKLPMQIGGATPNDPITTLSRGFHESLFA